MKFSVGTFCKILYEKPTMSLLSIVLLVTCCAHQVVLARNGINISTASKQTAPQYGKHHFHHQHSAAAAAANNHDRDTIKESSIKPTADTPIGCKELRSKKYISDGPCTSIKPIMEVVCAGICLPVTRLPWYSDLVGYRNANEEEEEWQCVDDAVKRKRVNLICQDGQERSYVIRTVRSCKCKKRKRLNNKTVKSKRKLQ